MTRLKANTFLPLRALKILGLNANDIETIEDGCFVGLENVYDFYMKGNNIKVLQADVFSGLEALQILNLQMNKIEIIEDGAFAGLERLETLLLSQNNLAELRSLMFTGLRSLQTLSLEGNRLTTVPVYAFSLLYHPLTLTLSTTREPAAYRNPLECDTNLCWLKQEQADETINFGDHKPICVNVGNWDTWTCSHERKYDQATNFAKGPFTPNES